MLIDDVQLSILPFPDRSRDDDEYDIKLTASDATVETLIIDAIESQYGREDLRYSLYEFFKQCAGVLMAYGQAAYEIVYLSTNEGKIDSVRLSLIAPSGFITKRVKFQQYQSTPTAEGSNQRGSFINLPAESVLLFKLPENMRARHDEMMQSLVFVGENIVPKFAIANMVNPTVPFSHDDYSLSRSIAVAKATKHIGWNARNYRNEHRFEHYVWHRQLIFYKFLCILREGILRTLNEGLTRIGSRMGFTAELSFENLPTANDADSALEKLHKGNLKTFNDVLKSFR
ncbi:MAG TPA: hypothetical protein VI306_21295 [Pyrinomonadaceae bacterium]